MKQLMKEELENCYVDSSEDVFEALKKIGFKAATAELGNGFGALEVLDIGNNAPVIYQTNRPEELSKKIYFHKGNFYAEPYQEEKELTYGETIKQPFPKFEDVDKFNVPEWIRLIITDAKPSHLSSKWDYKAFKLAYENGVDITWQLKQSNPHADIKAEYEKAIAGGKIVKVFCNGFQTTKPSWSKDSTYELRFYEIDWNKLLSWSYANGEFVKCQVCELDNFTIVREVRLYGLQASLTRCFIADKGAYKYCRLAKGVEIKDEWLKEIK